MLRRAKSLNFFSSFETLNLAWANDKKKASSNVVTKIVSCFCSLHFCAARVARRTVARELFATIANVLNILFVVNE